MSDTRRSQPTLRGDIRLVVAVIAGFVHRHRTFSVLVVAACCVIALGLAFELRISSYAGAPGEATEKYQAPLIVQIIVGVVFVPLFAICFRAMGLVVHPRRSGKSDS